MNKEKERKTVQRGERIMIVESFKGGNKKERKKERLFKGYKGGTKKERKMENGLKGRRKEEERIKEKKERLCNG